MTTTLKPRTFTTTLRYPAAQGASSYHTTVRSYFIVPFDCRLVSVQALGHGQAGTTAAKAALDLDPVCTNLDNTITAVATGVTGNDITVAIQDDTVSVKSSIDLSNYTTNCDTILQAATAGNSGDRIRVCFDWGGVGGPTCSEDLLAKIVYFHFEDGSSPTVSDFETLVGDSTLVEVKTAGTAANSLTQAADSISINDGAQLSGGYTTANTLTEASLNLATCCANLDTVIEAVDTAAGTAGGDTGNDILITIVGGASAQAGVIAEDTTTKKITIQLKDNTSTVADLEALVATCSLIDVKTTGTGANTFQQDDDCIFEVPLAGGVSVCHVAVSGTAITIGCKNAVTLSTDIDVALANSAAAVALVTCDAGAGGTFASTDDEIAATNLSGGCDAKPTIDVFKNGSRFMSDHLNTTTAITTYTGNLKDGQAGGRASSYKLSAGDKLSLRCTTTSSDGEVEHATATLTFEY